MVAILEYSLEVADWLLYNHADYHPIFWIPARILIMRII
jgi:hypothetical protein